MLGETFALANWTDRKRLSLADIQNASMATADNINADMILGRRLAYKNMIDSFLANIAPGKLAPTKVPFTVNFAPGLTCNVIKSLERKLPTTLDYQESRQIVAYTQDYINSQAAAFEHFMPENITTRMNFRVAEPAETTDTEPNTPVAETE